MQKRNVNGALRILNHNMSCGVSLQPDETLQLLELKYSDAKDTSQQGILQGPIKNASNFV